MNPQTWDALAMLWLIIGPPLFLTGLRLIMAAWESWRDRHPSRATYLRSGRWPDTI